MNIEEIVQIESLAGKDKPTGDAYLDELFSVVESAVYYRFLYHLVKILKPTLVVELGVEFGRSAAHMCAACPGCRVKAIDVEISHAFVTFLNWENYPKNFDLCCADSVDQKILNSVQDGSVDICFIDTVHTRERVLLEFNAWRPKMKPGGIMLFDDISENSSMIEVWEILKMVGPSVSLPHLHHSGFGVVLV